MTGLGSASFMRACASGSGDSRPNPDSAPCPVTGRSGTGASPTLSGWCWRSCWRWWPCWGWPRGPKRKPHLPTRKCRWSGRPSNGCRFPRCAMPPGPPRRMTRPCHRTSTVRVNPTISSTAACGCGPGPGLSGLWTRHRSSWSIPRASTGCWSGSAMPTGRPSGRTCAAAIMAHAGGWADRSLSCRPSGKCP
jgi:hypothetical protein